MKYAPIIFALVLSPAFAQQTFDDRVALQIGRAVMRGEGLQMQLDQTLAALKVAQDRVKALEEKYEPKKVGEAKPQ